MLNQCVIGPQFPNIGSVAKLLLRNLRIVLK